MWTARTYEGEIAYIIDEAAIQVDQGRQSATSMKIVIVPNSLSAEINALLDKVFVECPSAARDRDLLYHQLLDAFDMYGFVPEFTVVPPIE